MDQGGVSAALGARILTVGETFALGRFAPASVQRDFQWEERQCQDLFSDLERIFAAEEAVRPEEETAPEDSADGGGDLVPDKAALGALQRDYFLGAMVLRPGPDGRFEVFDGLQRLTSLTILIAVLRDLGGPAANDLHAMIATPDGEFRLMLPGKDDTLKVEVQKRGEAGKARRAQPASDMGARIRAACTLFRRELGVWDGQRRAAFADFLRHRVQLVSIATTDALLASQIFVTTNARGLALDKVELFKGQLVDIAGDEATAERIAESWTNVRNLVGDDLEDLLATLDFIERREPQGAERLTQLADHLLKHYGPTEIIRFVDRSDLYAKAWRELHQRLFDPGDADAGSSIWMLRLCKWREWKPLALIWTAQFIHQRGEGGADRARVLYARRFDALHRRCMAITLAGNSELDRTKIFGRAVGQVARKRDPLDRQGALGFDAQAQARIKETLRLPLVHDDTRLSLMRWLEALLWPPERPPRGIARASVEHVLPQRPKIGSTWLTRFPNEDARFNVCHALGNLALVDYKANEAMGNVDFDAKLPALTAQAQKYKTLSDVIVVSDWTAELIAARTRRLCDIVWRELELPEPRTPKRQP